MLKERLAEWVLLLVTTPDRASSVVGDLMEDVTARGGMWFWRCILQTIFSLVWRSFAASPFGMMAFAIASWFAYMAVSLFLWFAAGILMTLSWGLAYFFTHHTSLELLTNLLKLRLDWPALPFGTPHWAEFLLVCIASPFQVGRLTARFWLGHELAVWLVMGLIWPVLSIGIPFASASVKIELPMIPLIQISVLLGMLCERRLRKGTTADYSRV